MREGGVLSSHYLDTRINAGRRCVILPLPGYKDKCGKEVCYLPLPEIKG
jgi:hypothetical protein